ncbi:MAG: hypothetical protein IPO08_24895 [Xanthomonadales bacterium]|nr:hypothetical protein [Xanthomonadales bacterium]
MSEPTREQAHYLNERAMRLISKIMDKHTLAVLQGVWEELDKRGTVDAAARALVEKIDAIHASPDYEAVWTMAAHRGMPYRGPDIRANYRRCESAQERGAVE